MTILIQQSNITANQLVDGYSRYINQRVVYWGNDKKITFETYLRKPYVRKGTESVMVVTKGLEYRPDLLSYDYYGIPDFWWKILEVNGIKDIWEFKQGITIFLPSIF